jgi:hypothetical protein
MRIYLSEKDMAEVKRIVEKEFIIRGIEPTDDYLFINCFSKTHKETVYFHLFVENHTWIIRCYGRVFDNVGLSTMIRGTAKNVFNYLVNHSSLLHTMYIENGVSIGLN